MNTRLLKYFLVFIFSAAAIAQGVNSEVAVIYNKNSPYGYKIAKHYAKVYNIPDKFLIGIETVTIETCIKEYYIKFIRNPVREEIEKRNLDVKYLVTTKGMPLKIYVKYNYCYGIQAGGGAIESWLCLLNSDRILQCRNGAFVQSKYFNSNQPFEKNKFKFTTNCPKRVEGYIDYLVTRLDAYTYEDVIAMINRGVNSYKNGDAYFVLDRSPGHSDNMIETNRKLRQQKKKVKFENGKRNVLILKDKKTKKDLPVIGYCGHGAWAEGTPYMGWTERNGYLGGAKFNWVNGAVIYTHESFNAFSFNYRDNGCAYTKFRMGQKLGHADNQNLIADFIKDGGTAGIGRVYHPSGGVRRDRADESILFSKYAAGYNFIESAYQSIARLAFTEVVVGDPLCRILQKENNKHSTSSVYE